MNIIKSPPKDIPVIAFLLAAVFISHFLMINSYGLYEDDYAQAYYVNTDKNLSDAIDAGASDIARPVGRFIRYGLSYIGAELGGLISVYIIGYLIISLNTVLTYLIIRRLTPAFPAIIGALVFCLFPADTTKILMTHSLQLQPGLMFALLGIYMYQNGKRISPYIMGILCLLTYESTILPLLAAPLLKQKLGQKTGKEILINLAIIFSLIVLVLVYRNIAGEVRVTGLESFQPTDLLQRIWVAIAVGPLTSFAMFFYRPYTVLLEGGATTYILAAIFFAICFIVLKRYSTETVTTESRNYSIGPGLLPFQFNVSVSEPYGSAYRLLLTGFLLWSASYLFAFSNDHWPPLAINNRMTSVHLAASFAASLTLAGIAWITYIFIQTKKLNNIYLVAFISAYFSLLAGFSFIVQQDYATSWANQKIFWRQVIELTPDLDADKVVFLVAKKNFYSNQTKYIFTHSWANTIVLSTLYKYSSNNKPVFEWRKPRFDYLDTTTRNSFRIKDGVLVYDSYKIGSGKEEIQIESPQDIIIIYSADDGSLKRYQGPTKYNDFQIIIPEPSPATSLPTTKIYDLFMQAD